MTTTLSTAPPGDRPGLLPGPSLDEAEARLEAVTAARCSRTTRHNYRCLWRRFLVFQPTCSDQSLFEQAQRWLVTLPASRQRVGKAMLQAAYGRTACDWRGLELRRYRRNEARLLASLLRGDARRDLRALTLSPRDRALLETLWSLRRSEVARLRWQDLRLDEGLAFIPRGKGGKASWTLLMPLIPRLAAILTAYLRDARPALVLSAESSYVFPANCQPYGTRRDRHYHGAIPVRQGRRYRIALGAPLTTRAFAHVCAHRLAPIVGHPVNPHMLRHSFASRLRAKGADLQLIQEILGHASIQTTTMYAHISTPLRTATVARLLEEE